MTNAIVSGQARTALLIDGETLLSFDIDTPEILRPRRKTDFRFLFGEATDLRFIENTRKEEALKELRADYDKTCALDLALMLLDEDISETKPLIGEVLEELLAAENIVIYLESIFYAKPLPPGADLDKALHTCRDAFPQTYNWLTVLLEHQTDICLVREVWDNISTNVFGDEQKRADFQKVIIHEGIFRELVLHYRDNKKINSVSFNVRLNKSITSLPNHRAVLQALFASFSQPLVTLGAKRSLKNEDEETFSPRQKEPQRFNREAIKNNVQKQIEYIVEALKKRNQALAGKLTDELVDYQSRNGEPIHLVKSLCQLAQSAKELGFYKFQLELTEKAVELEYSDSWTQAQYGDALLRNNEFDKALKTFEIAISFLGGKDSERDAVVRSGYAEVLKAQGKLNQALQIYRDTMNAHPEDVFAKTGYAEVLRAQGKLDQALQIYKEIRNSHPEDVVARNGYAEVLKAQGKLDQALQIYHDTMNEHPENVVARNGYAEVLKAQGKLDQALQIYRDTMNAHPENVVARNGFCGVLFALELYEEALETLPADNLVTHSDWIGYHIRGMIMLKMGNLAEAVKIFEKGKKENPLPSSREYFCSALAIARLRQGEFETAEKLLSESATPLFQPAVNLLRVHALGELKLYERAETAFLEYKNAPIIKSIGSYLRKNTLELASEVDSRYVSGRISKETDAWLFDKEVDLLLALAP